MYFQLDSIVKYSHITVIYNTDYTDIVITFCTAVNIFEKRWHSIYNGYYCDQSLETRTRDHGNYFSTFFRGALKIHHFIKGEKYIWIDIF